MLVQDDRSCAGQARLILEGFQPQFPARIYVSWCNLIREFGISVGRSTDLWKRVLSLGRLEIAKGDPEPTVPSGSSTSDVTKVLAYRQKCTVSEHTQNRFIDVNFDGTGDKDGQEILSVCAKVHVDEPAVGCLKALLHPSMDPKPVIDVKVQKAHMKAERARLKEAAVAHKDGTATFQPDVYGNIDVFLAARRIPSKVGTAQARAIQTVFYLPEYKLLLQWVRSVVADRASDVTTCHEEMGRLKSGEMKDSEHLQPATFEDLFPELNFDDLPPDTQVMLRRLLPLWYKDPETGEFFCTDIALLQDVLHDASNACKWRTVKGYPGCQIKGVRATGTGVHADGKLMGSIVNELISMIRSIEKYWHGKFIDPATGKLLSAINAPPHRFKYIVEGTTQHTPPQTPQTSIRLSNPR